MNNDHFPKPWSNKKWFCWLFILSFCVFCISVWLGRSISIPPLPYSIVLRLAVMVSVAHLFMGTAFRRMMNGK